MSERPVLKLRDVWHCYGHSDQEWTIEGVDLDLHEGELLGLLGPSGCGKTTLLRLIAGFEAPERGTVSLYDQVLANGERFIPAERRGIGMVFQDGALFPHLTVWKNACFGLTRKHSRERVRWLLDLLGIGHLKGRYPHELSGGQRQRLALARSLAPSPALLLLDEPFSNLDVEVRMRLRQELPAVLKDCGVTAVMVTHDPEEALAICDKVGVIRSGQLQQLAEPQQLVREPANGFVASFVLGANLIPVYQSSDGCLSCLGPLTSEVTQNIENQWLMVPADSIALSMTEPCEWKIQSREFLGRSWRYQIIKDGSQLCVVEPIQNVWVPEDCCSVVWRERARARMIPVS